MLQDNAARSISAIEPAALRRLIRRELPPIKAIMQIGRDKDNQ
jgi:hypothetical protein